jgi:adenylate cyclase
MISSSEIHEASILVVDDQPAYVSLLEQILRGAGYIAVKTTTNSAEVCELHRQNRYDLILLDLQMPGVDGFQVMEGLKKIETDGYLPVLVLTAQPAHKLRALEAGAKDFLTKPFELPEVLVRVYNMLEVRLLHLETKRLYERLLEEQKRSDRLLLNVLPQPIAERLKGRYQFSTENFTEIIADSFPEVTVLFADIVGFTQFSTGVSAEALVELLNDLFTRFDRIADRQGLDKIKTIGDAYMAAGGLSGKITDHAVRAAHMALDIQEEMKRFNAERGCQLQVRIGVSTGPAVAGVIGRRKFFYDLWGDVVNTARRMESSGLAGRIQIAESTRCCLNEAFRLERRSIIEVKGKGSMQPWFLNGRSDSPFAGAARDPKAEPDLVAGAMPQEVLAAAG